MARHKSRVKNVVRSFTDGGLTYRLERVFCGKRNCHKCPHGPYWYVYGRRGGKPWCRYIGKSLANMSEKKGDELRSVSEEQKKERAATSDMFEASVKLNARGGAGK